MRVFRACDIPALQTGFCLFTFALVALLATQAAAQPMIANQVPLHNLSDGFFEQIGTGWSVRGRGFFFQMGGANPAVPPFGNPVPNAGGQLGFGFGGGGLSGNFGLIANQGSRRSNIMQSGNLTVMNGVPGFVGDVSQSPFVTGIRPIVGSRGVPWKQQLDGHIPLQRFPDRPATSPSAADADDLKLSPANPFPATGGLQSVEQIRNRQQAAQQAEDRAAVGEAREWFERAETAEAAGKGNVARLYYQMAARRADGSLKQQALDKIAELSNQGGRQ